MGESGEWDRAFDLLAPLAQWLYNRGRILDSLVELALFRKPEDLRLQNQGRLSTLLGQGWAGFGDLSQAATLIRKAVNAFMQLAAQDPSNAEWQRDLSVSYDRIGDVLGAQGSGEEALTAYRDSLEIRQRLAAQDPSNAQWQTDLVVSYWKLAQLLGGSAETNAEAGALLEQGLAILYRQRDEARLSAEQEQWIDLFEHALEGPPQANL